jgi:predicted enzyme related to lactoylglutathione lyase
MIKGLEGIGLFSENAKKLADFYKEKVGLKIKSEGEMGENNEGFYEMEVGDGPGFFIMDHSKVKGKNKNPEMIIFNLEVDDIEKEFERVKKAGVKVVAEVYHVEEYGLIATFEDVDGNYFQFVQIRATES